MKDCWSFGATLSAAAVVVDDEVTIGTVVVVVVRHLVQQTSFVAAVVAAALTAVVVAFVADGAVDVVDRIDFRSFDWLRSSWVAVDVACLLHEQMDAVVVVEIDANQTG